MVFYHNNYYKLIFLFFIMKRMYELLFLEPYYTGETRNGQKLVGGLGLSKIPYILGYDSHNGGDGMTVVEIHDAMKERGIRNDDIERYIADRCAVGNFKVDNEKGKFSLSSDLQKRVDTLVRGLMG